MSSPPSAKKKRMLLHGQWVEVTVLPPKPTPTDGITAQPRGLDVAEQDTTVFETPRPRRGKRKAD